MARSSAVRASEAERDRAVAAYTWLTMPEAADRAGVSVERVRRWIHSGELEALDIGTGAYRAYRIREEDLDRLAAPVASPKSRPAPSAGVYVVRDRDRPAVKIGTSIDQDRRLRSLRHASGLDLALVAWIPTPDRATAFSLETGLHSRFAGSRIPRTEWFHLTPEIEAWIEEVTA